MPDQKILNQIIKAVREVIEPDKIILFGSQAKGTASIDSDYDILIIKKEIPNYFDLLKRLYRNMLTLDAKVDFILKTSEEVEKSKQKFISVTKEALNEGIVIYE